LETSEVSERTNYAGINRTADWHLVSTAAPGTHRAGTPMDKGLGLVSQMVVEPCSLLGFEPAGAKVFFAIAGGSAADGASRILRDRGTNVTEQNDCDIVVGKTVQFSGEAKTAFGLGLSALAKPSGAEPAPLLRGGGFGAGALPQTFNSS
jgi:hypothetical protein